MRDRDLHRTDVLLVASALVGEAEQPVGGNLQRTTESLAARLLVAVPHEPVEADVEGACDAPRCAEENVASVALEFGDQGLLHVGTLPGGEIHLPKPQRMSSLEQALRDDDGPSIVDAFPRQSFLLGQAVFLRRP